LTDQTYLRPRLSIAVLPFLNLSQDPDLDYLADGVADNLMTDLSRALPGSLVISRSTVFTYKGRQVPIRQIGEELQVAMSYSPYDRPQRYFLAGLYDGFRPTWTRSGIMSSRPGFGEAVAFPLLSRTGLTTALAINSYKPDDLTMLRVLSSRPDRAGYSAALLQTLEELHPAIYERIDASRFGVQGPTDLAQAAVTPVVRRGYVDLGGGKYAIPLGDAHVTVDPMMAQGANIGSYSAFAVADEPCRQLADEYYDNFNRPEKRPPSPVSRGSGRGAWLHPAGEPIVVPCNRRGVLCRASRGRSEPVGDDLVGSTLTER
jgi:Styrene monooxygenase A putative substrate binding domain